MVNLLDLFLARRSVREYTDAKIPAEKLEKILAAGLASASGRGKRPWEFIVVEDRQSLNTLAKSRSAGAAMLQGAALAIVVVGDADKADTWIEDCSIAMTQMHLMATALGLGSCWIQGRMRESGDGRATEECVRDLLGFPQNMKLEAMLSIGMPAKQPAPQTLESLPMEKVHYGKYLGMKQK